MVKDNFHKFVQTWPINLCTKFGEATVSRFWVISLFPHVTTFFHCFICTDGTKKVSQRGVPNLKTQEGNSKEYFIQNNNLIEFEKF